MFNFFQFFFLLEISGTAEFSLGIKSYGFEGLLFKLAKLIVLLNLVWTFKVMVLVMQLSAHHEQPKCKLYIIFAQLTFVKLQLQLLSCLQIDQLAKLLFSTWNHLSTTYLPIYQRGKHDQNFFYGSEISKF